MCAFARLRHRRCRRQRHRCHRRIHSLNHNHNHEHSRIHCRRCCRYRRCRRRRRHRRCRRRLDVCVPTLCHLDDLHAIRTFPSAIVNPTYTTSKTEAVHNTTLAATARPSK